MAAQTSERRPTLPPSSRAAGSSRLLRVTLEGGTDIEITPEPSPEERAAIVAALEQLQAEEIRGPGAWWEAGLRESVEDDP
jgi:hypothetical protein